MEFAEHGSLRQHLRGMRGDHCSDAGLSWPRTILLNFATQIAGGMAYLESLKVSLSRRKIIEKENRDHRDFG